MIPYCSKNSRSVNGGNAEPEVPEVAKKALSFDEAVGMQRKLAVQVREVPLAGPIRTVAGADVAFTPDGRHAVAGIVVLLYRDLTVVDRASAAVPLEFPYVPGLLSFREAPAIVAAAERLSV